jgi:CRP/FNR family transcriptional regulator, cyclic AMP receptor protein
MAARSFDSGYMVWGLDQSAYGPVELSTLVSWVKDERVTARTWVFVGETGCWQRASELPELQGLLPPTDTQIVRRQRRAGQLRGVEPDKLRHVKLLRDMSAEQLARFARFVETRKVSEGSVIVGQGQRDDTLYMILEGEARVRMVVGGEEIVVAKLGPGEVFGDLALLDHGPRSADVVADTDCALAGISGAAFDDLTQAALDLSTPFLRALDKTLTERIRADNQRYSEALSFLRAAR